MKIWNVSIEPLEERYSSQWQKWFLDEFEKRNLEIVDVGGESSGQIAVGRFLDVIDTNRYKARQVQKICDRFSEIKEGDVFFFHDAWHPGVIFLKYMLDCSHVKNVKLCGCLHAGTYDCWDFLAQSGCSKWGIDFENSIFEIFDKIFVATSFHKEMVERNRRTQGKVIKTGFPIFPRHELVFDGKEDIVVFPHRLNIEKQPDVFEALAKKNSGKAKFLFTKHVCKNKSEYYELLRKSKVAVSCALQETWGIAMQEAVFEGCFPIVPSRLSYSEMYPVIFRYNDAQQLQERLDFALQNDCRAQIAELYSSFEVQGKEGLRRIVDELVAK